MFKPNRRHHVIALIVLVLVIFSASSMALVMSRDEGAPLKLRSIETSFDEKKSLFDNRKPLVRIYSHVHPAWPSKYPGGKELVPAPTNFVLNLLSILNSGQI